LPGVGGGGPSLQESEWPDIDERFLEGGDVGRFHLGTVQKKEDGV